MNTERQPALDFYAEVEVKSTEKTREQGIAGHKGAVAGIAQPEQVTEPVTYAVHLFGSEQTWSIEEGDLIATGRTIEREAIESGESLGVNERGEVQGD